MNHDYALETPETVALQLAQRCRQLRLMRRLKQSSLAERSGVSLGSLRRFEQTGQISLKHLLDLAFVLGRLGDLETVFQPPPADSIAALEAISRQPSQPKRGRR